MLSCVLGVIVYVMYVSLYVCAREEVGERKRKSESKYKEIEKQEAYRETGMGSAKER